MSKREIDHLKKLREKLNSQKMSSLVGAGFSKNVSKAFPSWSELIHELVIFLYQSEIDDSFSTATAAGSGTIDKTKFRDQKIEEIISRVGNLEIVSEYIKRKGFRESISTYIEKKVPYVKQCNLYVAGKKKARLDYEQFSLHRALLNLPWNNIYTTNYDELLEQSINVSLEKSIRDQMVNIENEIKDLFKKRDVKENQLGELRAKLDEKKKVLEKLESKPNKASGEDPFIDTPALETPLESSSWQKAQRDLHNLRFEEMRYQNEFENLNILIEDKEAAKGLLNRGLDECLAIVTHSSYLSIKRNKNIIKLHGTLRKKGDRFEFDGDIYKHYVIAKEDYETYPEKHEAFTQLMRISLLQESYCLIGFSGTDPNFLGWIGWVRDILERKPNEDQSKDYKIYLIDIDKEEVSDERRLFFENHRIIRIPILKNEILDYLESHVRILIKLTTQYYEADHPFW